MFKYLFLLLLISSVQAQKPEDFIHLKEEYPEKDYVILSDNKKVEISQEKDSLSIKVKNTTRRYYLNDKAGLYNKSSVTSSFFRELTDIKAYSLERKRNRYKKHKIKNFKTDKSISTSSFHDDIVTTSFEYEKLKPESIKVLEEEYVLKDAHLSQQMFFGDIVPQLEQNLTIEVDEGIELGFYYANCKLDDFEYKKVNKRNKTIYTFRKENQPAIKFEDNIPSVRYTVPHIIFWIKSYHFKNENKVPVLESASDLYSWYNELINRMKIENLEEVKSLALQISEGAETEIEVVERVFKWVQENIKYIAVEDGLGGLIPRGPDLVYNRRYGDCKDMSTLIVNLLRNNNINAYPVWIGTRELPYSYFDVPTPAVDNHMVAAYYDSTKSEYLFLDATDSHLPFGLPSTFIQGKEAMVNLEDSFEIARVPEVDYRKNLMYDSVYIKIVDRSISGSGYLEFNGYFASDYSHYLSMRTNDKSKKNHVKGITRKGNNKYELIDYTVLDHQAKHLAYKYNFKVADYLVFDDNEIYINLNLDRIYSRYEPLEDDRKNPVDKSFNKHIKYTFALEIPEGYELEYVPKSSSSKKNQFQYSISYSLNENVLTYQLEVIESILILYPQDFEAYNKFIKDLKQDYKESIVLKKVNHENNSINN